MPQYRSRAPVQSARGGLLNLYDLVLDVGRGNEGAQDTLVHQSMPSSGRAQVLAACVSQ